MKLHLNMHMPDRLIRAVIIAPALVVVAFLAGIGSVVGLMLLALTAIMLATAAVGFCPLYSLLGYGLHGMRGRTPRMQ